MTDQSMNPGLFAEDPGPSDAHDSSPPRQKRETQLDRVRRRLLETDDVCSSVFYRDYIPRFSVHIHLLRKAGYVITKRPCDRPEHDHEGTGWLWRLQSVPDEPR